MANKPDYLARLQLAIMQLHDCSALWRESVPVTEIFQDKIIWQGDVEVFDLAGHPKSKLCYGWSHPEGDDNTGERFVTVLEIPPVNSPQTAVKMAIYSDAKKKHLNTKQKTRLD